MAKLRLEIELEYDDELMHSNDKVAIKWFHEEILLGDSGLLLLHSNELGDNVGKVRGIKILAE